MKDFSTLKRLFTPNMLELMTAFKVKAQSILVSI